jgi:hypothetical protein
LPHIYTASRGDAADLARWGDPRDLATCAIFVCEGNCVMVAFCVIAMGVAFAPPIVVRTPHLTSTRASCGSTRPDRAAMTASRHQAAKHAPRRAPRARS